MLISKYIDAFDVLIINYLSGFETNNLRVNKFNEFA